MFRKTALMASLLFVSPLVFASPTPSRQVMAQQTIEVSNVLFQNADEIRRQLEGAKLENSGIGTGTVVTKNSIGNDAREFVFQLYSRPLTDTQPSLYVGSLTVRQNIFLTPGRRVVTYDVKAESAR